MVSIVPSVVEVVISRAPEEKIDHLEDYVTRQASEQEVAFSAIVSVVPAWPETLSAIGDTVPEVQKDVA